MQITRGLPGSSFRRSATALRLSANRWTATRTIFNGSAMTRRFANPLNPRQDHTRTFRANRSEAHDPHVAKCRRDVQLAKRRSVNTAPRKSATKCASVTSVLGRTVIHTMVSLQQHCRTAGSHMKSPLSVRASSFMGAKC